MHVCYGVILWTNALNALYSAELGVYAYAAAQVKKAIEVCVQWSMVVW